ncbi:MAG: DUF2149 domain-containing protein [Solirubrobacteraceae bacterium]|nr:DUF2149 domain-containing protein [Solirubrobacteraceae bacterium]
MSRIGLHRHGSAGEPQEDPLDGLVNLFDLGLVLAVAFLVAGLSIGQASVASPERSTPDDARSAQSQRQVTIPSSGQQADGQGSAVGTVYRLPDGTLVLDESATPSSEAP